MRKNKNSDEMVVDKNITRRCDGYSFRVRMMVSGVRIDERFDTLAEARAFRDRKRADLAMDPTAKLVLQSREAKREAARLTLGSLLERYEREVTPTKKGKQPELLKIKRLRGFSIVGLPAQFIDRTVLLDFLREGQAEGWSSSTARKYLMLISAVFTVAIQRWGHNLTNPVRSIEIPSNGAGRTRRLETGEYERLLVSLQKSRCHYMPALFVLAVETAARRGELLKLDWKDVDLMAGTAVLRDTKNGEDRVIPLSSLARKTLRSLPRTITGGQVFPVNENTLRTSFEMAIRRALRTYKKECAEVGKEPSAGFLAGLRFHDLRREATSRLFEKGFDIMEASAVTGHKTLSMLKRYTNLRAEDLAKKLG
ncbi:site-specific integrase [Uliginosibacterium paludis]|uniref:Site-specific integrase n=1 Tax=Uliginosibacterium paludis TaxID=1615952 RepID=A0ABV2CL79_9RHOO|nr:site-specific recombinase, phage integrase family [Pseudomonadota bacterium]